MQNEPTAPSPDTLTAMIKAEEEIIESYRRSDPEYYAYVKRHRSNGCSWALLYPDGYYRAKQELDRLYMATTYWLQKHRPDQYDVNVTAITNLEIQIGA